MNCDEFRERCHVLIDQGNDNPPDVGMLDHIESCPECAEFRKELSAIDAGLRRIPLVQVPAPLVESLLKIGEPAAHPSLSWRPDIGRAAMYLLPGILLWGAQWSFPESARPWILGAITFVGGFIFVTSVLRPRLLGQPPIN